LEHNVSKFGIIVTGYPGSGSTSLGKNLARILRWEPLYYSGGLVRRLTLEIEERGLEETLKLSVAQAKQMVKSGEIPLQPNISSAYRDFPDELDLLVDNVQLELLETEEVGVHEGRVAPHLVAKILREGKVPDKIFIKICCVVESFIGALRQQKREENKNKAISQILQETEKRLKWERDRYLKLYGIQDYFHPDHFDIIIDTSRLMEEETLKYALREIDKFHPGFLEVGRTK
jgi:cytidylate kinase